VVSVSSRTIIAVRADIQEAKSVLPADPIGAFRLLHLKYARSKVLRKLVALIIFGGLAKIRGALWIVVQLLTFWNSYKKGKDGPDDDLADTRRDKNEAEKKDAEPDD
jgi:hypothetical protein